MTPPSGREALGSSPSVPTPNEATAKMSFDDNSTGPATDEPDSQSADGQPEIEIDDDLAGPLVELLGTKTRARIYVALRMAPSQTSAEVADLTDIFPSTVREQLASMHDDGLLSRSKRENDGRGNNPYAYRAVSPENLVSRRTARLEDRLNSIYHLDRLLRDEEAEFDSNPVTIAVESE